MEAIERRAAWVAITLALTLSAGAFPGFYLLSELGKWDLVAYLGGLVCQAAAGVLLVGALAPDSVRPFSLEGRARFVYFAFALLVLAIIVTLGLSAHGAIEAHRHPEG